jgi:hypothetical protein
MQEIPPVDAGSALFFDGTDDFVNIPHDASLSLQNLTVEAWVRIEDPNFFRRPFISKGANFGNYTLSVLGNLTLETPGLVEYIHHLISGANFSCCGGTALVAFRDWTHVAATYSANTVTLYVNGQLVGSSDSAPAPLTNMDNLSLGRAVFSSSSPQFLAGQLDEVRIWNVVRTGTQITNNFNRLIDPNEPGLVGYWNFDEAGPDQNVLDSSASANDGTLGTSSGIGPDDPVRIPSTAPLVP